MTIDLITKNKIADYAERNPEGYAYFITWLKESRYRDRPRHLDIDTPESTITISEQLGASKYVMRYTVNIPLKTAYIEFFGTREEERAHHDNWVREYMAKHPGEKLVTTTNTVTVTVKAPSVPKKEPTLPTITVPAAGSEEFEFPVGMHIDLPYQTNQEYETNLARAITIFKAQPGTDEHNELTTLLSSIKAYESANIKLPQFNMLTALKLRMRDFQLTPNELTYIIGNTEEVELFLSGEKTPPNSILKKIYNMMGLKIPADRNDFISN